MQSEWKVTSNVIGNKKMYSVYRLRDTSETDHSGNREYACTYMDSKDDAISLANELNQVSLFNISK